MRWLFPARVVFVAVSVATVAGCGPVSATLHDPHALPELESDSRIHYEPAARDYAEAVAAILPRAVAKIEAAHGRSFNDTFIVAVYADEAAYAAANGRGDTMASGVTFLSRVTLSPRLWLEDRARLERVLTHELSHEHFAGSLWIWQDYRIPVWFNEGFAVLASDGGGAEYVSQAEAEESIRQGRMIETPDQPSLLANFSLQAPAASRADEAPRHRAHMAYRQASLFVGWLRNSDPAAFRSLIDRLYAGERFKPAFESSFGTTLSAVRDRFTASMSAG